MTFIHFLSCAGLAFGPHAIVYKTRGLGDWGARGAVLLGAGAFLAAQLARLLALGLLLVPTTAAAPGRVDAVLEAMRALLVVADVAALAVASARLASGPARVRATAVGLGWALCESLCMRLPRLWVGARGLDWSWAFLALAAESGFALAGAVAAALFVVVRRGRAFDAAAALTLALPPLCDALLPPAAAFAARAAVAAASLLAAKRFVRTKDD